MKNIIITIDGPSGTGKSTVARAVAKALGYVFLDTGALYRTAALAVDRRQADIDNDTVCGNIVAQIDIRFDQERVFLDGVDVSDAIRTSHISDLSSRIAIHHSVRQGLLNLQRSFAHEFSLVAEGRDTGSVVFPAADVKIFLDASPQVRAQRRHLELKAKGGEAGYTEVLADIEDRDRRDASRVHAPMVIPDHAVVVDTTHLSLDEVIQEVLRVVRGRLSD